MGKYLYVCEKPSIEEAISSILGVEEDKKSYKICKGGDIIVKCYGHMLELEEPDIYTSDDIPRNKNGNKEWREEDLPIIPKKWLLKPSEKTSKHLEIVVSLLKRSDITTIVHAGDIDREGQLLIDEILEFYNITGKKVLRYWCNSVVVETIKKALKDLKDNTEKLYRGMNAEAKARQRADWLIGMNLSRAQTLRVKKSGVSMLVPVGRVQTPTLNLVVQRDLLIENFKPVSYFNIYAQLSKENTTFNALLVLLNDEHEGLDEDNRLISSDVADKIIDFLKDKKATVIEYEKTKKKEYHPLPYTLDSLTLVAANQYGYTAEEILNCTQALYDKYKLTTYPRTDVPYLSSDHFAESDRIFASLTKLLPEFSDLINKADLKIQSKAFNDKELGDSPHHGIIPTFTGSVNGLSKNERNIYKLIVYRYIAQFYPVHEFYATSIGFEIEDYKLKTTGRTIINNGWKEILSNSKKKNNEEELPSFIKGDVVDCIDVKKISGQTKPPTRFNEGTLRDAMANIHKYVEDPEQKKLLKEKDGLGSSATRAEIIKELKERNFLEFNDNKLISTSFARQIIKILPPTLTSPVLTAILERAIGGLREDPSKLDEVIKMIQSFVEKQVVLARNAKTPKFEGLPNTSIKTNFKCHVCGFHLMRRERSSKDGKKKAFYYACSKYPDCKQTYPEINGQPNFNVKRK